MKFIFQIFFFLLGISIQAQGDVLALADSMPKFPGGDKELVMFIQKNVNYPPMARENNENGKVYVAFVVDTNGKIINQSVLKSSGYKSLDNEALNVISKMPAWQPGIDKGKKVKVLMNIPVTFKSLGTVRNKEELKSREISANMQLAKDSYDKGEKTESIRYYNKAIALDSLYEKAKYEKALILIELNKNEEACIILSGIKDYQSDKVYKLKKKNCTN